MGTAERCTVIIQDCARFFTVQAARQSSTVEHRRSVSSELPTIMMVLKAWNYEGWSENVSSELNSMAYLADGRLFGVDARMGEFSSGRHAQGKW